MSYKIFRFICFFVIINVYCNSQPIIEDDVNWDKIIFSQQWPISSCIEHREKNPHGSCTLYQNMTSWTVHGLWPTLSGTEGPNFCNTSWPFDMKQLIPIEPKLLKYWPNIFADTSEDSLWKHEWTKHGTCAAELPALNSEKNYFSKGIAWAEKYDIVAMLGNWKIYPNDASAYSLDEIYSALKYHTHTNPIIDCNYNEKRKMHELSQIKLCFNTEFKMIDCSASESNNLQKIHGNCPPNGIIYPSSVHVDGFTYRYSPSLAKKHTASWNQVNNYCNVWPCQTFRAVSFFMLFP